MWDLLVWQGKHSQAPVAVAAKPNYFSELDMKKTIQNLLKHHTEFFSSDLMLDSLKTGDITALDRAYFCQVMALQLPVSCSPTSIAVCVTSPVFCNWSVPVAKGLLATCVQAPEPERDPSVLLHDTCAPHTSCSITA